MSAYRKGYRAERDFMAYMAKVADFRSIRSSGSHTPIDILCGNGSMVYAVQVKYGTRKRKVNKEELREWAKRFMAKPVIASRKPHGEWVIEDV